MEVKPTAGAMQLNRIVGAYSRAIVLVATCMWSMTDGNEWEKSYCHCRFRCIVKCKSGARTGASSAGQVSRKPEDRAIRM